MFTAVAKAKSPVRRSNDKLRDNALAVTKVVFAVFVDIDCDEELRCSANQHRPMGEKGAVNVL